VAGAGRTAAHRGDCEASASERGERRRCRRRRRGAEEARRRPGSAVEEGRVRASPALRFHATFETSFPNFPNLLGYAQIRARERIADRADRYRYR